jgi:hypothetical protein
LAHTTPTFAARQKYWCLLCVSLDMRKLVRADRQCIANRRAPSLISVIAHVVLVLLLVGAQVRTNHCCQMSLPEIVAGRFSVASGCCQRSKASVSCCQAFSVANACCQGCQCCQMRLADACVAQDCYQRSERGHRLSMFAISLVSPEVVARGLRVARSYCQGVVCRPRLLRDM